MAFVISLCKGRVYILNTAFGAIWVFILFNICFINSSFTSCSPSVLLFLYISPIYSFQVEILSTSVSIILNSFSQSILKTIKVEKQDH